MQKSKKAPDLSTWERMLQHYEKQSVEHMPTLSIVIPCFNQAHVLENTLKSLFSQKNVPLEIIIIDAGSTDTTFTLIQQHHEKIARVYYATEYNITLMMNKGVSIAKGDYVCFVPPGYEYLNPYCLCQIARTAVENNSPDFIYSADNHIEEALKNYKQVLAESVTELHPSFTIYPFSKEYLKRGFLPTSPVCMWFKKDSLEEVGQLNLRYSFTKSIFDLLCRLYRRKETRTATTFWAMSDTSWKEKSFINAATLWERWVLVIKYFGPLEGFLWLFRDKPIHIFSWLLNSLNGIFRREG